MTWYNIGTVTATNSSTTITGSGTAFLANVRVGDGLTVAGSTSIHEVTNVASDTSLTISPAYTGTTGSGKTYAIAPVQGYVKDLADQVKSLIQSYGSVGSSDSITALKAVAPVVNRVPMYTGGTTATSISVTPFSQTLLDDTTQAAWQATLGLVLQTALNDSTVGRLMTTGAFGLGGDASGTGLTFSDANTIPNVTGFFGAAGTLTNNPSTGNVGDLVMQIRFNANSKVQLWFGYATQRMWYRNWNISSWTTWREIYNAGNMNSTVINTALGYTPVQQGTGVGQGANVIKIGYATDAYTGCIKATVDVTEFGALWTDSVAPSRIATIVVPGGVGSYCFMKNVSGTTLSLGQNVSSAAVAYSDNTGANYGTPSGTWKCCSAVAANNSTIFLRIL